MANKFVPWIDAPIEGETTQAQETFAEDVQRVNGFIAGDPASAIRVNSALRQANVVAAALMQLADDMKALPDIDLNSSVTDIANALKSSIIDQIESQIPTTDNAVLVVEQDLTDEQKEQARMNINAQTANLFFKNVQVPANSFVADTTYDDYPFRAAIELSGVTDTMVPNVCFGVAQATDANYAPVADSYNGGVYLYAKKMNDALFSIPFISLEVTE